MLTAHCFKGNYKGLHVLSFIQQSFHLKNGTFEDLLYRSIKVLET